MRNAPTPHDGTRHATQTWWIQTLTSLGSVASPSVVARHSVEAPSATAAVERLRRTLDASQKPAPIVLPDIVERSNESEESGTVKSLKNAVRQVFEAKPCGLVITDIGTDFANVSGLGAARAHRSAD